MGQFESLVLGNPEIDKRKRLIEEHKDSTGNGDPNDAIDNDTKFRKIMQTFNLAEHNHRDPYLGTVEVFRCNHNREFRIYLREILAKSEEELHEDMAQWQRRMLELKHPNLIQLYGCCHQRIENLCGQFYKIFLIFDSVESDLAKQCRDSALNETELWEVIDSVVGSLSFLQERDLPHEAIRSNTIYVCSIPSGSKALKIADSQLMGYDSNYLKALTAKNQNQTNMSSSTGYLSPLQYTQLGMRADSPKHDPFKSDVFALGMLILDLALFEWSGDVYNQADYTINTKILEDKLNRLSQLVSKQLMEVIIMMLRLSETDRPDLRSLDRHLSSMPSLFDKRAAQNIQLTDLRRIPPLVNKQMLEATKKAELEKNSDKKKEVQDPNSTESLLGLISNHLKNDDSSKPDAIAIVKESLKKTNLLAKFMFKQNSQHTDTTNLAMLLQNAEKEDSQNLNQQNLDANQNPNGGANLGDNQLQEQQQKAQHTKNLLTKVVKNFAIPVTHHSPLKKNNNNMLSNTQSLSNNTNNLQNNVNNTQNTTSNNIQSNNNQTIPQQQQQIQGNVNINQNAQNQQQKQDDEQSQYPYFHIPTEEQEEQKEQVQQNNNNNNENNDINQFNQRAPANPKLSDILKTKALEFNHLATDKQQGEQQHQQLPQDQQMLQQQPQQELFNQQQGQQQQQQQSLKSSMIRKPGDLSGNPSRRLTIKDISDMQKTITTPVRQTIKYADGNIYEGDVLDGKKHGYGVFVFSSGQRYEGNWVNNKQQGKGQQFFSNRKLKYDGMWEAGQYSGQGILYNKEPKPFIPQLPQSQANNNNNNLLVQQQQQQQLMLIILSLYQDLSTAGESWVKYEGEFKVGKKNGLGTIAYLSGNQFIGQFANGAAFGQGSYMFGDGSRFVTGEWANDKMIKEY